MRTCVGCRRRTQVSDLQRCALSATGQLIASSSAPGRGAWVCAGSTLCVQRAVSARRFDRAFKRPVGSQAMAAFLEAFASGTPNVRQSTSPGGAAMVPTSPTKG